MSDTVFEENKCKCHFKGRLKLKEDYSLVRLFNSDEIFSLEHHFVKNDDIFPVLQELENHITNLKDYCNCTYPYKKNSEKCCICNIYVFGFLDNNDHITIVDNFHLPILKHITMSNVRDYNSKETFVWHSFDKAINILKNIKFEEKAIQNIGKYKGFITLSLLHAIRLTYKKEDITEGWFTVNGGGLFGKKKVDKKKVIDNGKTMFPKDNIKFKKINLNIDTKTSDKK
jgi:hypothetical protein